MAYERIRVYVEDEVVTDVKEQRPRGVHLVPKRLGALQRVACGEAAWVAEGLEVVAVMQRVPAVARRCEQARRVAVKADHVHAHDRGALVRCQVVECRHARSERQIPRVFLLDERREAQRPLTALRHDLRLEIAFVGMMLDDHRSARRVRRRALRRAEQDLPALIRKCAA